MKRSETTGKSWSHGPARRLRCHDDVDSTLRLPLMRALLRGAPIEDSTAIGQPEAEELAAFLRGAAAPRQNPPVGELHPQSMFSS